MIRTIVSGLFFVALTGTSLANCKVEYFKFYFNFDSQAAIHAESGRACPLRLTVSALEGLQIVKQPQHGTAAYNGSFSDIVVNYKSVAGYKGADEFVFAATGGDPKHHGTANVTVTVDVN
jgi:hypothetical protein